MNPTVFGAAAIVAYLAATAILVRSLGSDFISSPTSATQRFRIGGLAWAAALLHLASISDMCDRHGNVDFNFYTTSSLAALSIVVVLLLASLAKPVDKLGIVIFPLAGLVVLLEINLHEPAHVLKAYSWQMNIHILVSMLSYSFLNIAALQALLVAVQDWNLHNRHPTGFIRSLPPLQTMEKLLFQLIGAGFVLLSISLLTGLLFVEDLFAQHLVHKTVLSILAWLVFGILLIGRIWWGWRGQTAIRWTLGGFVSLMLAYFGSKLVLELILNRT
ncbi:MAG: phosphohydrolase [Methylococcaceae bacterium]|nr:phosphohydrolase [Methylococcaceae bacterium]